MPTAYDRLSQSFFDRSALDLAVDLLGRYIRHHDVVLRIAEVEAYCGPDDSAAHARTGPTDRNAPLFGPAGHAYVYLVYGLHQMLNIVAGPPGEGVLIRACEPVDGLDVVQARRGGRTGPVLLNGPGKVGQALGVDVTFSHQPLYEAGGVEVLHGAPPTSHRVGVRIGIDYATPEDRDALRRFALPDSTWVGYRNALQPAG